MSVDYIGPFQHHDVLVDGRRVPFIEATPIDGGVHLTLDGRFGLDLTAAQALDVVPFLAHSIAVALGYTCHPNAEKEPLRSNPFTRMIGLAQTGPEEYTEVERVDDVPPEGLADA